MSGLTTKQQKCLSYLSMRPGVLARRMEEALGLEGSQVLRGLHKRGLVAREDPAPALWFITTEGLNALRSADAAPPAARREFLSSQQHAESEELSTNASDWS